MIRMSLQFYIIIKAKSIHIVYLYTSYTYTHTLYYTSYTFIPSKYACIHVYFKNALNTLYAPDFIKVCPEALDTAGAVFSVPPLLEVAVDAGVRGGRPLVEAGARGTALVY